MGLSASISLWFSTISEATLLVVASECRASSSGIALTTFIPSSGRATRSSVT